jgi:sulfite reductase alpha subunit-like flavoprotein
MPPTVYWGGEVSSSIASSLLAAAQSLATPLDIAVSPMSALKKPDLVALSSSPDPLIFILQTAENAEPPEDAERLLGYFKRRTHPDTLLNGVRFAVLGVGDSNLLLDRQSTSAKDCNQAAQLLDRRLGELGGGRLLERGEADERTGLEEVGPWIEALLSVLGGGA